MYFGQIEKFLDISRHNVFIDKNCDEIPEYCNQLINDENNEYYLRFLNCLSQVSEKYVLFMAEDFILYDKVENEKIQRIVKFLNNTNYSCVRLIKSGVEGGDLVNADENIYEIPNSSQYHFSHQATIWKKDDLYKLYNFFKPSHLRDAELYGTFAMKSTNMKGCYVYNNEPRRGSLHFDSSVFPYISTAVCKGKWNLKQYPKILRSIMKQYNVDYKLRGIY
tara:strand:+ start:1049 stop:1711 length:663 start_codon:yes stop_codon:yes gene_type:complete